MSAAPYDPQVVQAWIDDDPDEATAQELRDLLAAAGGGDRQASQDLADRFSGVLKFGTAGLRGVVGGGPNRMNRAVVIKAAAGLTKFLADRLPQGFTVVVGHDARHGSRRFALDTAAVVEAGGGHALLFDGHCPTPLTAFALQKLQADAAVMVTASHNPPRDNGYKVYLGGQIVTDSGRSAQIVPPYDAQIFEAIESVTSVKAVPRANSGWETIGPEMADAYLNRIEQIVPAGPRDLRIVLTAMHGVGGPLAVAALRRVGFTDIHCVAEQQEPDPDFPTVAFPNPEEAGALDLAIQLANRVQADLILANDPDADRSSAAIPDPTSDTGWRQLTGDEIGGLLGEQAAQQQQAQQVGQPAGSGELAVLANSIVSSRLLSKIAADYGLAYQATLTGFKWISRVPGIVFGYEEAIGYCVDPSYVRDKDGISASTKLAVLAAAQKAAGSDLQALLDSQARRYGLHATAPLTIRVDDLSLLAQGMANLRANPPLTLAGSPVVEALDLQEGSAQLPPTDGLWYRTEADDRVVARPSGTEPKLKCYLEVVVPVGPDTDLSQARRQGTERLEQIRADLREALGI